MFTYKICVVLFGLWKKQSRRRRRKIVDIALNYLNHYIIVCIRVTLIQKR